MKNKKVITKTKITTSTKSGLLIMMLAGFTIMFNFIGLMVTVPNKNYQTVEVNTDYNFTNEDEITAPEFITNQLLIKYSNGISNRQGIVDEKLSIPQSIYVNKETGKILQSNTKEYTNIAKSSVQLEDYSKETITPKLKSRKNIFKSTNNTLNQWEIITLENEIDVNQLKATFLSTDEIEYAEPNYIVHTTEIPNDPFFSSSNSWGQGYDDLWGLKHINALDAWRMLFGKGDINYDGNINSADVDLLFDYMLNHITPDPIEIGDFDNNNRITMDDVIYLNNHINNPADYPLDNYSQNEVIVAVVDTGVDYNHEDINDNIWLNTDEIANNEIDDDDNGYIDDIRGWNFNWSPWTTIDNTDTMDDNGHGSHVAGTIAAEWNNEKGVIGICPYCKIMSLKVLGSNGAGPISAVAAGVEYATNNGARVINLSLSTAVSFDQTLNDAIEYALSNNVVVVAAAGNDHTDANNYYPASSPYVITVASLDHNNIRSDFSNFGSAIDIAAPGGDSTVNDQLPTVPQRNILSIKTSDTNLEDDTYLLDNGKYMRLRGTSMAAPHVAGLAGLILLQHPEFSVNDIKTSIYISANDLYRGIGSNCTTRTTEEQCLMYEGCYWWRTGLFSFRCIDDPMRTYGYGWDQYTGYGIVDVYETLKIQNPPYPLCYDDTPSGQCNESDRYCENGQLLTRTCGICNIGCPSGYLCDGGKCCKKIDNNYECLDVDDVSNVPNAL